jgi:outer membrane lipoprotein-sorting protein
MYIKRKTIVLIFVMLGLLFLSATITAQNTFEGKVKFKVSGDDSDKASVIDYFIKDDKIRMEVKDAMGAVIIFDKSTVKMLMESQGMYMEYPRDMMMGQMEHDNEKHNDEFAPTMTNNTKEILGYECKQWIMESDDGTIEMWVTDELGSFVPMQSPMGGGEVPDWQKQMADGNFFPMLVIVNDDGDKISAFEVVEVNKQDLNDNLFSVPKGLKKMDMPFKMD